MALRVIKLHYVLVYAVLGALMPYLSIYGQQRGLTDAQIGWVIGVFGLAVIVAPPIHTLLADRWLTNRALIITCFALGAMALVGLMLSGGFIGILATYMLFSLGFTSLIPLLDGLTFDITRPLVAGHGPTTPFPTIRVWGSVGFILPGVAVAALWLTDLSESTVVRMALGLGGAVCAAGVFSAMRLPANHSAARNDDTTALPTVQALGAMSRPPLAVFIGSMVLLFMAIAILYAFYPLYLHKLDVPAAFVGLIVNFGVVVEIGFIVACGWLFGKIGLRGVALLGAASMAVRMAAMAIWPNVAVAIGTQVFHGPIVLAMYVVPPMYLNHKALPGYRNSIQGLYTMLAFGVARLVGSALGGHVSDWAGGQTMAGLQAAFWLAAAMAAVALGWLAFGFRDRAACRSFQPRPSS